MTFSVKLTKFDDAKKIALIKEIRTAVPGLNLVQAKKVGVCHSQFFRGVICEVLFLVCGNSSCCGEGGYG